MFTSREKAILTYTINWILAAVENPDLVGMDLSSLDGQDIKRSALLMAVIETLEPHIKDDREEFTRKGVELFDMVVKLKDRADSKLITTH